MADWIIAGAIVIFAAIGFVALSVCIALAAAAIIQSPRRRATDFLRHPPDDTQCNEDFPRGLEPYRPRVYPPRDGPNDDDAA